MKVHSAIRNAIMSPWHADEHEVRAAITSYFFEGSERAPVFFRHAWTSKRQGEDPVPLEGCPFCFIMDAATPGHVLAEQINAAHELQASVIYGFTSCIRMPRELISGEVSALSKVDRLYLTHGLANPDGYVSCMQELT